MEFNLQQFLADMRREQREDMQQLRDELEQQRVVQAQQHAQALTVMQEQDKRLSVVEGTRKSMLWAGGLTLTALVTSLVDLVINHFPKLTK